MKKIKIKITPDVSGQASGVRFFENFLFKQVKSRTISTSPVRDNRHRKFQR